MYATTPLQAEPKLIFGSWLSSLPTLNFVVVLSNQRSRQSSIKMENCGFIFLYKFLQRAYFHMHTHPTTSTHPSIHPFGSVNSFARELRAHRTKQTRLRDYRTALRVLVDSPYKLSRTTNLLNGQRLYHFTRNRERTIPNKHGSEAAAVQLFQSW